MMISVRKKNTIVTVASSVSDTQVDSKNGSIGSEKSDTYCQIKWRDSQSPIKKK